MKTEELNGRRFGRLLVVSRTPLRSGGCIVWQCLCDCGKRHNVRGSHLKSGKIRSCGCFQKESRIATHTKHGHSRKGMRTDEYSIWRDMKNRCEYKNDLSYKYYGGRGIKVCERWQKFENFLEDMGERPSKIHSLNRIDNDGDYCFENCGWATHEEQQNNKRNNRRISFDGKTMTVRQWERWLGVSRGLVEGRLLSGWHSERALTEAKH